MVKTFREVTSRKVLDYRLNISEARNVLPLGPGHAPSRETVVLTTVVRTRADIRAIEMQAVGVRRIAGSRRPIVATRASIVRLRTTPVAGIDEIIRIASNNGG